MQILRSLESEALPAAIERSVELFYEGHRNPRRALVFNTAAGELQSRDREREATHFANRGIAADPRAALGWSVRSSSRLEHGAPELAGAIADLFVASELDPRMTARYWEIEERMLRFPQLFPLLGQGVQELREERPDFAVGWFLQGYIHFRQRDYPLSLEWFERAQAQCRGRSYVTQVYIAASLIRLRRLDEARAALFEADSLLPSGQLASYWRACLDALGGDLDAAKARLMVLIRQGSLREAQLKGVPELGPLEDDIDLREALRDR